MRKALWLAALVPTLASAQMMGWFGYGGAGGGGGGSIAYDATFNSGAPQKLALTSAVATFTVSTAAAGRDLFLGVPVTDADGTAITVGGTCGLTWTQRYQTNAFGVVAAQWWTAHAAAQLTACTVTVSASGNRAPTLFVFSGARDVTSLTAGVDYATGGFNSNGTTAWTASVTTIGTSGSILLAVGDKYNATDGAPVADASSTLIGEDHVSTTHWSERSTGTYSAGSHAIGLTTTANKVDAIAVIEVLAAP